MAGEELARRIVERELKRAVHINDDGSTPGMYDLRVGSPHAPEMAIECVGAVDKIFTETWNVGPAKGPIELSIKGDWIVTVTNKARIKIVKQRIEQILQVLEDQETYEIHVDYRLEYSDSKLFEKLESLGITHIACYRPQGTGKVHFGMPGIGGPVDTEGSSISKWVSTFLSETALKDVLQKLKRSAAKERHVFLFVTFGGAPWSVESYLTGDFEQLPSQGPDLPQPVTGVWIVSGFGQKGLRWNGATWQLFLARGEGIDDQ